MTPLEIQNHRFRRRFSGVDPTEVESFLRMVGEDYEALHRDHERQSDQVRQLQRQLDEHQANEALLKETLVSAQAMSEEIQRTAVKEAEVLLGEAEVRAEKILDAAHRRAAQLAQDIRDMRAVRTRLAAALRASMDTHLGIIDCLEQDPEEEDPLIDGKITYLGRKAEGRNARTDQEAGGAT